jgi:hypothetical protein
MIDNNRQAVVIIHGIGEQKPMSTLRGFVSTMTAQFGEEGDAIKFYNKPDTLSNLFELRRLTTPESGERLKTDFFEYYWAYNLRDTKVTQVLKWISGILLRWPWTLPARIAKFHVLIWIMVLASAFIFIKGNTWALPVDSVWLGVLMSLMTFLFTYIITGYVGDAARYTSANPENIAERQKIRQDGILLLKSLHESGKYKKIIIVGHSLGSIIGYDLIKNLWSEYNTKYQDKISPGILQAFEKKFAGLKPENFPLDEYREEQELMRVRQNADGNPWLISDFVTMGSPLTYSCFLLAEDSTELQERIGERELPSCPPVYEDRFGRKEFSYTPDKEKSNRVFHHAAPFACTRWTNIFYGNDFVGGPLSKIYGPGIKEYKINIHDSFLLGKVPFLSHTHYWGDAKSGYKRCADSMQIMKSVLGFTAW